MKQPTPPSRAHRSAATQHTAIIAAGIVSLAFGPAALAQPDPSGIEFVTIGDVGNPNWTGGGVNAGHGSVGYEYRMGKFEVTTAQWVEFMNAGFDRPSGDSIPFLGSTRAWTAEPISPQNGGTRRWAVPAGGEMNVVSGISWRTCAIYCNWLHNGKGTNREAFLSGAYDVSTFGGTIGFTDQVTRSPGAQYWIPSIDEWMKAAHWDPNKNGAGQGGYWLWANSSDTFPVYGPPGLFVDGQPTTANAGWNGSIYPGFDPFTIPLNAYPTALSPWGLVDTAGGASEWTEGAFYDVGENLLRERYYEGGSRGSSVFNSDHVRSLAGGMLPTFDGYTQGFRIAAAVPAPGVIAVMGVCVVVMGRRRL